MKKQNDNNNVKTTTAKAEVQTEAKVKAEVKVRKHYFIYSPTHGFLLKGKDITPTFGYGEPTSFSTRREALFVVRFFGKMSGETLQVLGTVA